MKLGTVYSFELQASGGRANGTDNYILSPVSGAAK
jgi:hypothetical protein